MPPSTTAPAGRKQHPVTIYLDEGQYAAVREAAWTERTSMSSRIRQCIEKDVPGAAGLNSEGPGR